MGNSFVDWLIRPFKESLQSDETITPEPEIPTPLVYTDKQPPAPPTTFRPQNFDQYIGQQRVKNIIKSFIRGTKKRNRIFPHTLIHGKAGCGKTTLAKILANEVGVKFIEIITSSIDQFWKLRRLINQNPGQIIFLDEIHDLDRSTAENLYTMMEDFTYNGEPIEEFTLVGATTELGEILKDRKPFFERFKIRPPATELEDYTVGDMIQIAKQYKNKVFPTDPLSDEVFQKLAENSRNVPRNIIMLIDATVYSEDVDKTLKNFGIIKGGYTVNDLKTLKYISKSEKGVGLQSIASFLGTSTENYLYQVEPFLLQTGIIIRTPRGRKISKKGIELIKELEKV